MFVGNRMDFCMWYLRLCISFFDPILPSKSGVDDICLKPHIIFFLNNCC